MFLEVVAVLSVVCGKEAARYDELVMTMMEEGVMKFLLDYFSRTLRSSSTNYLEDPADQIKIKQKYKASIHSFTHISCI